MPRPILADTHIHPAIRDKVSNLHSDTVKEVQAAVGANAVVIVGMGGNPMVKKARRLCDDAGMAYKYLEYGNYLNSWRKRNALKLWTGWPTFPMVFVKGVLVGGADDVLKLLASGEMKKLHG